MYYTKELKARVVGIRNYTGKTKEEKTYTLYFANIIYESDNNYTVGNCVASYIYNPKKMDLEVGKEYKMQLVGTKKDEKIYYEIMSANENK